MYVKKSTSFCQALEKMHTKEKWFFFSASRCRLQVTLAGQWTYLARQLLG